MIDLKESSLMEQVLAVGKDDILRMVELGVFALLTLMVLMMVVRPLVRQIRAPSATANGVGGLLATGPNGETLALPGPAGTALAPAGAATNFEQIADQLPPGHINRLGEMVKQSPGESVAIIRSWLNNPR